VKITLNLSVLLIYLIYR